MVNKTYAAIIAIVIIIVVVAGAATFALLQNENDRKTDHDTSVGNDSGELQATVTIENGTLNPANLTVKAGTTVKWIVKDDSDEMYMVTSNATGSVEGRYLFMSDHLTNGQSFTYKFEKAGTYDYYDMDHMDDGKLIGTIIVT